MAEHRDAGPNAVPPQSERLSYRQWEVTDVDVVLDIYGRADVYRFLGSAPAPLPDVDAAAERIGRWRSRAGQDAGIWAVVPLAGPMADRPVGSVLLLPLPRSDGAPSDVHEIGWHLHPDAWGHGYATEAARSAIELARRTGLGQVRAVVLPGNERSVRVCDRLGMAARRLTQEWYGITMLEFVLELDYRLAEAASSRRP